MVSLAVSTCVRSFQNNLHFIGRANQFIVHHKILQVQITQVPAGRRVPLPPSCPPFPVTQFRALSVVARPTDGRKLFHRWRICSPSGGGAAADATDSAAHSHRKRSISAKSSFLGRRKSLQEKPASCPSLPKNDERRLGRGRRQKLKIWE